MLQQSLATARRDLRAVAVFCLPILLAFCMMPLSAAAADEGADEQAQQNKNARAAFKPWYATSISPKFPVSPASIIILVGSIVWLLLKWSGPPVYCVASHILIPKHDEASREQLEKYKTSIGSDLSAFKSCAMKVSSCPSKRSGGNLGKFKQNDMAPQFDEVCFSPETPVNTTVGPIETQFGFHLIYIHDRKI